MVAKNVEDIPRTGDFRGFTDDGASRRWDAIDAARDGDRQLS
jgi:hypothetical protein